VTLTAAANCHDMTRVKQQSNILRVIASQVHSRGTHHRERSRRDLIRVRDELRGWMDRSDQ
jgi:hypothetical protein